MRLFSLRMAHVKKSKKLFGFQKKVFFDVLFKVF
jgi:hypothetical protein